MNALRAISLVEGIEEGDEADTLEAWQHLIDSGMVWHLQGSYGRMAEQLINAGLCNPPM
jgi:hypothetical protein